MFGAVRQCGADANERVLPETRSPNARTVSLMEETTATSRGAYCRNEQLRAISNFSTDYAETLNRNFHTLTSMFSSSNFSTYAFVKFNLNYDFVL